jgi:hypothetical protein
MGQIVYTMPSKRCDSTPDRAVSQGGGTARQRICNVARRERNAELRVDRLGDPPVAPDRNERPLASVTRAGET